MMGDKIRNSLMVVFAINIMLTGCTSNNNVEERPQGTGESRASIIIGGVKLRFIEIDGMEFMIVGSKYEGSAYSPYAVNLTLQKAELESLKN